MGNSLGLLHIHELDWQQGSHDRTGASPHPKEGYTWTHSPLWLKDREMIRETKNKSLNNKCLRSLASVTGRKKKKCRKPRLACFISLTLQVVQSADRNSLNDQTLSVSHDIFNANHINLFFKPCLINFYSSNVSWILCCEQTKLRSCSCLFTLLILNCVSCLALFLSNLCITCIYVLCK